MYRQTASQPACPSPLLVDEVCRGFPRPSSTRLSFSRPARANQRASKRASTVSVTLLGCSCHLQRVHHDLTVPATADTSIYGDIDNHTDLTAPLLGTMTDPLANGDRLSSPGKIIPGKIDRPRGGRDRVSSIRGIAAIDGSSSDLLQSLSDMPRLTRPRGFVARSVCPAHQVSLANDIDSCSFASTRPHR